PFFAPGEKGNLDLEFWGSAASAALFTAPFFTWFSITFPFQICESDVYTFPLHCQSKREVVRFDLTKVRNNLEIPKKNVNYFRLCLKTRYTTSR
ncbi:MAG: hypothetical protein IKZ51_05760, partial [Bacteroidales bacterium]|nr:hypothetical protein [Bacteroidales bacterium]